MILSDVNILVHAFRSDSDHHDKCKIWLSDIINGDGLYGMSPQVLSSVVRITTHPKIFVQPSHPEDVFEFCEILLSQPNCIVIHPGSRHWEIFYRLCKEADARGNLIQDAWFAALAIESGCEWITMDRDFARFPGLQWKIPE